ncbi:hypothetical protein HWV62_45116 [Athelia sp. TMB]|nr:hypothetical protein HWV62_45116 [Athelia sp. TMB]
MSLKLAGKSAIVTGSSRSIGAAIAQRLAEDGANVIINYVSNSQAADQVVESINSKGAGKAVAVQADVSSAAGAKQLLDATIAAFGQLDILVLNAGIMGSKALADVDEQFFDSHIQINVKGPLFLTKAAAPLIPTGALPTSSLFHSFAHDTTIGGRIIFFSSSLTKATTLLPNALVYVASKGAVEQICRVLAKDLGARGITVNTVSPGPVDTPLFREGKTEQQIAFIAGLNPSKRLGTPEEIAPAVAFLASPEATWVNGQNILVNGVSVASCIMVLALTFAQGFVV